MIRKLLYNFLEKDLREKFSSAIVSFHCVDWETRGLMVDRAIEMLKGVYAYPEQWSEMGDAERTLGAERSPKWKQFCKDMEKMWGNRCLVTDSEIIQWHHVLPFHLFPESELDPQNVRPLRPDVHFLLAHLGKWASYNENILRDIEIWKAKIANRP